MTDYDEALAFAETLGLDSTEYLYDDDEDTWECDMYHRHYNITYTELDGDPCPDLDESWGGEA